MSCKRQIFTAYKLIENKNDCNDFMGIETINVGCILQWTAVQKTLS